LAAWRSTAEMGVNTCRLRVEEETSGQSFLAALSIATVDLGERRDAEVIE
jgi:hypothetical protein